MNQRVLIHMLVPQLWYRNETHIRLDCMQCGNSFLARTNARHEGYFGQIGRTQVFQQHRLLQRI